MLHSQFLITISLLITSFFTHPVHSVLVYPNVTVDEAVQIQQSHSIVMLMPVTFELQHKMGDSLRNHHLVFIKKVFKEYLDELLASFNFFSSDRLGEFRVLGHYLALMGDEIQYSFFVTATADGMVRKVEKMMVKAKDYLKIQLQKSFSEIMTDRNLLALSVFFMKSFELISPKRFAAEDARKLSEILHWPVISATRGKTRNITGCLNNPDEHPYDEYAILCDRMLKCGVDQCRVREVLMPNKKGMEEEVYDLVDMTVWTLLPVMPPGNESWYHPMTHKNIMESHIKSKGRIPKHWDSYDPKSPTAYNYKDWKKLDYMRAAVQSGIGCAYRNYFGDITAETPFGTNLLIAWCNK